jgi:cyclic beta-1,2-glucan synthetase
VTVRNVITSMRLITDVDWTELFERVSLVDEVFKAENRFAEMDFPTRNLYRTAVEQLARGSRFTELEVADAAVVAARRAHRADAEASDVRLADPGYYLIASTEHSESAAMSAPARSSPRACWLPRCLSSP